MSVNSGGVSSNIVQADSSSRLKDDVTGKAKFVVPADKGVATSAPYGNATDVASGFKPLGGSVTSE